MKNIVKDTVLIIGASGFLGSELFLLFSSSAEFEVVGTSYSQSKSYTLNESQMAQTISLDITDAKQVKEVIEKINPGIVIIAAALANMDICETERELAVKINVQGVENVVRCCQNRKVVYYSTDAIFDGVRGDYREDAQPHPVNFYGETKLQAEKIIKTLPDHLILRICMMYGDHRDGPKFINWLIRNLSEKKVVNVATDFTTRPTFVGDIAKATRELLKKKRTGVYHVTSPSILSCYAMAQTIAKIWKFEPLLIHPVRRKDLPWKARRAENATLNIDKFMKEDITLLAFEEGMHKIYKQKSTFE